MAIVTVASLKQAGYQISSLKEETQVQLAEANIIEAYFPTTETFTTGETVALLHALTYSLLLKRKTVSTRYGSSEKTSQYTISADENQIKQEIRTYCRARLENYLNSLDVEFEPIDLLEIYTKLFLI
ncbi:hypothetical protein UFOVP756_44 [uncultured Caudovirales phage]|jgi:hypothetical protein|uniref:Uncharacterized protein n=1 Tax=uncultured Caudovirales phage TaxID=2100421 RepID=A0A6J7X659_9CAUD|nr:hypothetical protein UFOVP756_44 [uncultured Caudovirales phage]